ncbi:hypothetical protein GQ53DRAFT_337004 [Thozetella sp. PMI_491]|nr:hypothetical protein GQ53DRAFT_337004 [Thozetella sp. PMI_491]
MQITSILVLVSTALALPTSSVSKRDLATIQKAIGTVQTALGGLDTAIKGLSTDPNTAAPILTSSTGVQSAIKQATADISASQMLSLTDALSLQKTATGLTDTVKTVTGDLTGKKAILDQLGVTSVAVQTLQQQKTDSAALGKAIVSKVPAIGQSIAQQSIDQINTAIDAGITTLMTGTPAAGGNGTAAPAKRRSTWGKSLPVKLAA